MAYNLSILLSSVTNYEDSVTWLQKVWTSQRLLLCCFPGFKYSLTIKAVIGKFSLLHLLCSPLLGNREKGTWRVKQEGVLFSLTSLHGWAILCTIASHEKLCRNILEPSLVEDGLLKWLPAYLIRGCTAGTPDIHCPWATFPKVWVLLEVEPGRRSVCRLFIWKIPETLLGSGEVRWEGEAGKRSELSSHLLSGGLELNATGETLGKCIEPTPLSFPN